MIRAGAHQEATACPARSIGEARAPVPGPTLVIVGGLHANEPAGIEAARRVHAAIRDGRPRLAAGHLVSLRGNLAALTAEPEHRSRYIDEDLNRAFRSSEDPSSTSTAEQVQRREIETEFDRIDSAARGAVHLLDLHTVSSESPPFLVLEDSLVARRFASRLPLPMVLGLEEELRGLMIDDATQRLGWISCIIESGLHDDPRSADVHEALILLALQSLGMIAAGGPTSAGEDPRAVAAAAAGKRASRVYDIRQRVPISHDSFTMLPAASAFTRVRARRTILAMQHSEAVTAEADGLLFMPNRQRDRRVGDDGFFVVQRVGRFWLGLSGVLRRRELVHTLLPAVMPGVRRRPGDPGAILIAPEYAAILRREILHLLGYRLIRWRHAPYLTRSQRILRGASAVVRSISGILSRAATGGERAALPAERDDDWIARRRRLDLSPPHPFRKESDL